MTKVNETGPKLQEEILRLTKENDDLRAEIEDLQVEIENLALGASLDTVSVDEYEDMQEILERLLRLIFPFQDNSRFTNEILTVPQAIEHRYVLQRGECYYRR